MSDTATDTPPEPIPLAEVSRTYIYDGHQIEYTSVRELRVSPSGNHRLTLANGKLVIVAAGWRSIVIDNGGRGWDA